MAIKLRRETLAEQVAMQLLDYMRARELPPGAVLPSEARLGAEYGVSRQVVREALRSLQGRGVLAIMNGRGAVVRPFHGEAISFTFSRAIQLDTRSLVELMEVRTGLEVECATLAAQRRAEAEVAELAEIAARMRASLHDEDAYAGLDLAFHLAIARASHNALLYHLVDSIREAAKDAIRAGLRRQRTEEQLEALQLGHEVILREIERGRPAAAARLMARHLRGAANYFTSVERAGAAGHVAGRGDRAADGREQPA